MGSIAFVFGACLGVYVLSFITGAAINGVASLINRPVSKRKGTFAAIGIATLVAFVVSGFGEGSLSAPDYSYSWAYLVAGVVVFLYERYRLASTEAEADAAEAEG